MNHRRLPKRSASAQRAGFTLFELLAVMAIILLILGISLGSFLGWSRGSEIDATGAALVSHLGLARQWAITHREPVTFQWDENAYSLSYTNGLIGSTNRLPTGLIFLTGTVNRVVFRPSGRCDRNPTNWPTTSLSRQLVLREARGATNDVTMAVQISAMTGLARASMLPSGVTNVVDQGALP